MTTQVILLLDPRVNFVESTMIYIFRDFVRIYSYLSCLYGGEDTLEFLDGVCKVLSSMGVTYREKAELACYQFRDISEVWYTQWKDSRPDYSGPIA